MNENSLPPTILDSEEIADKMWFGSNLDDNFSAILEPDRYFYLIRTCFEHLFVHNDAKQISNPVTCLLYKDKNTVSDIKQAFSDFRYVSHLTRAGKKHINKMTTIIPKKENALHLEGIDYTSKLRGFKKPGKRSDNQKGAYFFDIIYVDSIQDSPYTITRENLISGLLPSLKEAIRIANIAGIQISVQKKKKPRMILRMFRFRTLKNFLNTSKKFFEKILFIQDFFIDHPVADVHYAISLDSNSDFVIEFSVQVLIAANNRARLEEIRNRITSILKIYRFDVKNSNHLSKSYKSRRVELFNEREPIKKITVPPSLIRRLLVEETSHFQINDVSTSKTQLDQLEKDELKILNSVKKH